MSRKLTVEIEKTLKKVVEGVEVFESIFSKIEQATNQSQKEKLEGELKKEIKKLQRYRDQIKTWHASNEVKDKKALQDSRKLIETQMEKFKAMEKELKTKAYSAAGLNAASKMDPEEIRKEEIRRWISDQTDTLETQIDTLEAEKETLVDSSKAERMEKIKHWIERHRYHQNRLEVVLRMIDNGNLKPDQVDSIKEDVKYYIEENQDPEFEENEYIYEDLNLEEAEVYFGNDDDDGSEKEEEKSGKKEPEYRKPSVAPEEPKPASPKGSTTPRRSLKKEELAKKAASIPTARVSTTPRASAPTPVDPPVPAPVLRYAAAAAIAIPKTADPEQVISSPDPTPAEVSGKVKKVSAPLAALTSSGPGQSQTSATQQKVVVPLELASLLTPLPTPEFKDIKLPSNLTDLVSSFESTKEKARRNDRTFVNSMIDLSFLNLPDAVDSAKLKTYFPQNPYPVPGYFPQTPVSVFTTSPAIFERFDMDTLFFIFYNRPGSYQQYLAARELKRQSWRFHKKYLTWFQRHEEPVEVNEEYEQGTYIYFDYERTWTQRKKNDFSAVARQEQAAALDPKIEKIVDEIAKLNLLEASSLVSALKIKLNISDVVMAGPAPIAGSAAPAASQEVAEEKKEAAQTSFKVTLEKFDAASKAKVIKEIKQLLPGANLVEAKKFVEGAPKMIRDNVPKEEAEKIKKALEAVGATVVLA